MTFRLHAPGAREVELMADFTAWRPLALRRTGDAWIVTLAVPPGMRQLNVRIDGGDWAPPPGTTTADDGFGGRVRVVVVE